MGNIVVIGSINIDLTVSAERFPAVGETLFGTGFATYCGGKGANQAVAAARLGSRVSMVGCVGKDANGAIALENFKQEKVDVSCVETIKESTGVALITVAEEDNEIIVIKGANAYVSIETVKKAEPLLHKADMVLLQLEIPLDTVAYVLEYCQKNHIATMLNPAPYQPFPREFLDLASYITPNESEIRQLSCTSFEDTLALYPNKMVMTAGSRGVYYHDGTSLIHAKAHAVSVVDTTGAGDTFNGALATALCEHQPLSTAIAFAQRASALAIGKMGAQTAMPMRNEIE